MPGASQAGTRLNPSVVAGEVSLMAWCEQGVIKHFGRRGIGLLAAIGLQQFHSLGDDAHEIVPVCEDVLAGRLAVDLATGGMLVGDVIKGRVEYAEWDSGAQQ